MHCLSECVLQRSLPHGVISFRYEKERMLIKPTAWSICPPPVACGATLAVSRIELGSCAVSRLDHTQMINVSEYLKHEYMSLV